VQALQVRAAVVGKVRDLPTAVFALATPESPVCDVTIFCFLICLRTFCSLTKA
jgi:hypothetical protein